VFYYFKVEAENSRHSRNFVKSQVPTATLALQCMTVNFKRKASLHRRWYT